MKSNRLLTLRGLLVAILGGIVILSSCRQDETVPGFSDPSREVTFSAYAKKSSLTRVTEITSDNIQDFDIYGIYNDGVNTPYYLDKIGGAASNNGAGGAAYVSGGKDNWSYTPKQLWPASGTINFYAYSPSKTGVGAPNFLYANEVITYTVPALNDPQEDLLVAVKTGVNCAIHDAVNLNFQHALSRIQLRARPASTGVTYKVINVKFLNLYNEGTLALNSGKIPDGGGFTYNDDANDPDRDPLTLWTPTGDPEEDYEFDFSGSNVPVDGTVGNDGSTYADIITGSDAFVVLPQETVLGGTVAPGDPDPVEKFYVKITYSSSDAPGETLVKYFAVREPLNPALNRPLTFEIGRSYTFVVDLSGNEYINFAEVNVSLFNEAFGNDIPTVDITPDPDPALTEAHMPAPHKGFAGSNIYWDGEKLTFDDVNVTDHEQYQGLYFKWGSLVGISPKGANNDSFGDDVPIYAPVGDNGKHEAVLISDVYEIDAQTPPATPDEWWSIIATGSARDFSDTGDPIVGGADFDLRKSGYVSYLNTLPAELAVFKGDICAYLSGRPGIPEGYWRLPTSAEFDPGYPETFVQEDHYMIEGTFGTKTSTEDDGTFVIDNGHFLTSSAANAQPVFFPASGNRNSTNGVLSNLGLNGFVWSSSPNGVYGLYLSFASTLNPAIAGSRAHSFPVRCVKK